MIIMLIAIIFLHKILMRNQLKTTHSDDPFFYDIAMKKEFQSKNPFGQNDRITKWKKSVITYTINGNFTKKNEQDINDIFKRLSRLTNLKFLRKESEKCDIFITLNDEIKINNIVTENAKNINGLALCSLGTFSNNLEKCDIQIRKNTNIDDTTIRNILLEEITQSMGLFNDSETEQDSIFYKYKSDISKYDKYTEEDERIIRKLYNVQ